jgi:hypothetical protein
MGTTQARKACLPAYRLVSRTSAIASQLRRNAEQLQRSRAHTSSALVFGLQIANVARRQRRAHRFFTPQHGVHTAATSERLAPKHPGGQFFFLPMRCRRKAKAARQTSEKSKR